MIKRDICSTRFTIKLQGNEILDAMAANREARKITPG